jgi:hypothetical protein
MHHLPFAPDAVRWHPLTPPADPRAIAQPQVPALAAFWRRVRARFAEDDPGFAARIAERANLIVGLGAELVEALGRPLDVGALQAIHVLATRDQTAARAITADGGFKYVPFPYGRLKDKPNTLTQHGRIIREFCPPEDVPRELGRLVAVHDAIPEELPDVRAAWLVHALLAVHPFVDGNGRTSRLLASRPFLALELPPIWSETSERGAGWNEVLDDAVRSDGLAGLARLFASHQERLLLRLLGEVEAPVPDADLEAVLAHDGRLKAARAHWADLAASTAASVPELVARAAERLAAVGPRLDADASVQVVDGADGVRAAFEVCGESGTSVDRRSVGGAAILELPSRQVTLRIGVAHVGASGSGALVAAASVRPRASGAAHVPPMLIVPEEPRDARATRFSAWLERGLPDLVACVVRMA